MYESYLGSVYAFAGNFAPRGWTECKGQLMAISQNTALFSLLGTTYGGNGQTTFGLPNLQGCAAIHQGSGPGLSSYQLGETGGVTTVTLMGSNMPAHTHTVSIAISAYSEVGDTISPAGNYPAMADEAGNLLSQYSASQNCNMGNPGSISLAPSGGSAPITIETPYLTITYCIVLSGIFPSRA